MELLKQNIQEPNCLAIAAVMVLRHTVEIHRPWYVSTAHADNLFETIGHRGQEIIWPGSEYSQKLKGIHPQEIIDWYINFGYTLWLLERFPRSAPRGLEKEAVMLWDGEGANTRFWNLLKKRAAILTTVTHAVAWDGYKGYDPNGHIIEKEDLENLVREGWLIVRL